MIELALRAPQALVEQLSDALVDELDALSVSVEDADAGTDDELPLFGEPGMAPPAPAWTHSMLRVLFDDEDTANAAAAALLARPDADRLSLQSLAAVPAQDWVRLTQSQFEPVAITPTFWIVPSWHAPPASAERVIRLDPGLAFGTGTHPTTRMCLRWIAAQAPAVAASWDRVLDYGCGSGILAIGCALHGARAVDAVDIDPAAVTATLSNASANDVALSAGAPETAQGRYPLVLANILATPLTLLAPLLAEHVGDGGDLVLAGILDRQQQSLRVAYAPWLELDVADTQDGWILMTGRRKRSPGA